MKPDGVRYLGYDPKTEETRYACHKRWGTGTPQFNAHLIAGAPKLLKALKNLLDNTDAGLWVNCEEVIAARAAITETEGK